MPAEVFISYSRKDSEFALKLRADLERRGISVWIDQGDIVAGEAWRRQIVAGIQGCRVFLVVLSPHSSESENVVKELSIAEGGRKKIVPIVYQPVDIPEEMEYQLAGLQYQSFDKGSYEDNLARLVQVIMTQPAKKGASSIPAKRATPKSNARLVLIGLGCGGVVILLLVAGMAALLLGVMQDNPPVPEMTIVAVPTTRPLPTGPAPVPPVAEPVSGTCLSGYVWREASPSDKVCVTPAARAQAQADNAAADSRREVAASGPDTCQTGFVWREAYSGDVVCVTPPIRSQAQSDNAAAVSRWVSGAYGPHTCISGYVWREAWSGDDVCVTPDVRTQTANDNVAAASRILLLNGPDTCKSGYVWREAFSDDHVCVKPEVHAQTLSENAAAPSHTAP